MLGELFAFKNADRRTLDGALLASIGLVVSPAQLLVQLSLEVVNVLTDNAQRRGLRRMGAVFILYGVTGDLLLIGDLALNDRGLRVRLALLCLIP